MASQYTAGELQSLYYVPESVFGTTPGNALTFGGDLISLKPTWDMKRQYVVQAGSRSFGTTTVGPYHAGYSAKLYSRAAVDWRNLFGNYTFGSTTGLTDHQSSFSTLVGKKVNGSPKYNLYNGCKMSKLVISSDLPGHPWEFDIDVISQGITPSTAKSFAGLQNVTIGADPANPPATVDSWIAPIQINIANAGSGVFPVKKISLTVDNKMAGRPGNIRGADGAYYPLEAGLGIDEGERDIIVDFTLDSTNEVYSNSKLSNQNITLMSIPVGAHTIFPANGVWEANDLPEVKQGLMEETGRIRCSSLTVI